MFYKGNTTTDMDRRIFLKTMGTATAAAADKPPEPPLQEETQTPEEDEKEGGEQA